MRAKYWILAGLLAFLIAVPFAAAQSKVTVTVPFDFFVASTMMPAGSYECIVDQPFVGHMTLRHADDPGISVMLLTQGVGKNPETNKLVFRRYGDTYVLHQVWMDTFDHGHDLLHRAEIPEL